MNQKDINNLNWLTEKKDKFIKVSDNLYVRLRKTNTTYIIRKTVNKKAQVITLGKHPALKLAKAKTESLKYLNNDVSSVTTDTLISDYLTDVVYPESKVPKQVEGYLRQIKGRFGRMKVIDVKRFELVKFIKNYSKTQGARSADRLRSYLKQLFSYGVELGYLSGENPMEGVTKRVTGYKPIDRKRTLTEEEIQMVWKWRNAKKGWQKTEDNVRVIKFLLLTGLRISEAQTGYIDGDKFRIDDTKGKHSKEEKRPHWVYLTDTAKALLPLPKCSATNIQAWLKRKLSNEGIENRFTPHDCRRTYATIANDNGIEPFIVERALNHRMQGVMATYNHAEYKADRINCAKVVESAILEIIGG
ncbi:MAG: integrase family protein [Gammaproteobacteria bacterium]|nr:integrase family protein [Gammaproteobacteria bacterium]